MAKRKPGRPKKSNLTINTNDLIDFIKANPELLRELTINAPAAEVKETEPVEQQSSQHQIRPPQTAPTRTTNVYKPDKPIEFFDDDTIGQAERSFDKRWYNGYVPSKSNKRNPAVKIPVVCEGCKAHEEISEALYSSEHSYYCQRCIRRKQK